MAGAVACAGVVACGPVHSGHIANPVLGGGQTPLTWPLAEETRELATAMRRCSASSHCRMSLLATCCRCASVSNSSSDCRPHMLLQMAGIRRERSCKSAWMASLTCLSFWAVSLPAACSCASV